MSVFTKGDLVKKRTELKNALAAKLNQFEKAPAPPSADDWAGYETQEAELKAIDEQIDSIERLERLSREKAKESTASVGNPRPTLLNKPWSGLGEFLSAVAQAGTPGGRIDPRLSEQLAAGSSEGVPSEGGFLVEKTIVQKVMQKVYEDGRIASLCTRIGVGPRSNGVKIPFIDERSRANGSRWGGVQAYWVNEAGAPTSTKPAIGKIDLSLEKLAALWYATDELLSDTAAMESIAMTAFPAEIRFKLEDAILNGDGSGKPLGILNANCLVTQAKESGQSAATVVYNNVLKMWSRLYGPSRRTAVWLINQDVEPQLATMSLTVGTGGSAVYLPAGGASAAPYGRLFGRPVIPVEQCATVGTKGDIVLADFSAYLLIDKAIQAASSAHVRFIYDEMTFRWVYRVNGQPAWNSALTPYKGSNTLSPFVALAARS